jgi:hypothetical protein
MDVVRDNLVGLVPVPASRMPLLRSLRALTPLGMLGLSLVLLGFIGRIWLSAISLGSNDWWTWNQFGHVLLGYGLLDSYALLKDLNHPPLPALWSELAAWISDSASISFPAIFRIPAIIADAGTTWLLYLIWKEKSGRAAWGWVAAVAFAWNLDAIFIGAYHCNTDNICAFFTLLSAWFLQSPRRRFMAGGLALAAAINVKIVPVVLLPAFFALCRSRNDLGRFIGGLTLAATPIVIVFLAIPDTFYRNVFAYNSMAGEWGIMFFAMYGQFLPAIKTQSHAFGVWYLAFGKWIMLGAAAALGLLAWRRKATDAYELGAMAWCIFLVLTPGFGFQYSVFVAPLLMAASLRAGAFYGLMAGLFVATAYAGSWFGTLPLQSIFTGQPNPLPVPLGLVAWTGLVVYLVRTLLAPLQVLRAQVLAANLLDRQPRSIDADELAMPGYSARPADRRDAPISVG